MTVCLFGAKFTRPSLNLSYYYTFQNLMPNQSPRHHITPMSVPPTTKFESIILICVREALMSYGDAEGSHENYHLIQLLRTGSNSEYYK